MLKVMVVDDSNIMRINLKTFLNNIGAKVITEAKSGKEAIMKYEQFKPDLVTMDITMPIMNGIVATKEIIEKDPKANIIMITSHGQEKMVIEAIQSGAKGYILKPVTEEKLEESIDKLFGNTNQ